MGRAQFKAGYMQDAQSTWEAVRESDPGDPEANLTLGTIYQRLKDLANSNLALQRVTALKTATARDLAEAHALMGRNQKQLWQDEWKAAEAGERRLRAFRSPLLLEAYRQYRQAFLQDLNAYYPGINALAMLAIFFELAKAFPQEWTEQFEEERQAGCQRAELEKEYRELQSARYCRSRPAAGSCDAAFQECLPELVTSDPVPICWLSARAHRRERKLHNNAGTTSGRRVRQTNWEVEVSLRRERKPGLEITVARSAAALPAAGLPPELPSSRW